MINYARAIEDSTLKGCTIKPTGSSDILCSGEIKRCNEHQIYIEIHEGFEYLQSSYANEAQFFNVNFFINRSTFQLQHNAISWMQKHNLFSLLIKNPLYDREHQAPSSTTEECEFG